MVAGEAKLAPWSLDCTKGSLAAAGAAYGRSWLRVDHQRERSAGVDPACKWPRRSRLRPAASLRKEEILEDEESFLLE